MIEGFEDRVRDTKLMQAGNLQQFINMQPQQQGVARAAGPLPRIVSTAPQTEHEADKPLLTSLVTPEFIAPPTSTYSTVNRGKKVDGEGIIVVRDKAKTIVATDKAQKPGSLAQARPVQVARNTAAQKYKVDKELHVLYKKLRYNIF